LVGEGSTHNKAWVTGCTAKVDQAAFCKNDHRVAVVEGVAINRADIGRLDFLFLDLAFANLSFKPSDVDFGVEVTNVANDGVVWHLRKVLAKDDVFVTGGGCSGFQYGFSFDESVAEDDTIVEKEGVTVVADPLSIQYLMGSTVDYEEGLQGSKFSVSNPNATTTCGCGSSFSV